jgi:hypothetical protein
MPRGNFRYVIRVGRFTVKLPTPRFWRHARCCNRWEREMWCVWRLRFKWECLCPVLFADRFGFAVVMRRAEQPVTVEEIEEVAEPLYPDVTCEWKPADCGRIDGRIVALDYGLPDNDAMRERREYYRTFAPR